MWVKNKTYRLREREQRDRGDERIAAETNKTALEHMDFTHVNQYSSPGLPVEQWGQREERAERQMIQREGCGMSCVKKEILIGGKEREKIPMHVLRKEEKGTDILHFEATLL